MFNRKRYIKIYRMGRIERKDIKHGSIERKI